MVLSAKVDSLVFLATRILRALGYGLYLIKKMMEVYGWTIQEVGEPRKGAVFTIKMPKVK
jgi:signal transduction histidine kinase